MKEPRKSLADKLKQDIVPDGVDRFKKLSNATTSKFTPKSSQNSSSPESTYEKGAFTRETKYATGTYGAKITSENPYSRPDVEPNGTFEKGSFTQQPTPHPADRLAALREQGIPENLKNNKGLLGCLGCLGCSGIIFIFLLILAIFGSLISGGDSTEPASDETSSPTQVSTPTPSATSETPKVTASPSPAEIESTIPAEVSTVQAPEPIPEQTIPVEEVAPPAPVETFVETAPEPPAATQPAQFFQAPAEPAPAPVQENLNFGSCAEAKAAGYSHIPAGHPAYSSKLDRDGDGIACDK